MQTARYAAYLSEGSARGEKCPPRLWRLCFGLLERRRRCRTRREKNFVSWPTTLGRRVKDQLCDYAPIASLASDRVVYLDDPDEVRKACQSNKTHHVGRKTTLICSTLVFVAVD